MLSLTTENYVGTTITRNEHVSGVHTVPVNACRFPASGYGPKIPTDHMVTYAGRRRRVYVAQYGNSGSAYIIVNGEPAVLDHDTEYQVMAND